MLGYVSAFGVVRISDSWVLWGFEVGWLRS